MKKLILKSHAWKGGYYVSNGVLLLQHTDLGKAMDKNTDLQLSWEVAKCRAQQVRTKPDPTGMSYLGTPKHLARNATSSTLNARDERPPFVVDSRVLQRKNLLFRRNDRPEIQPHRASTSSIKPCPDKMQIRSYRLKHVEHAQWDIKIRHVVPLESLEISQKNSSDRSAECWDQSTSSQGRSSIIS